MKSNFKKSNNDNREWASMNITRKPKLSVVVPQDAKDFEPVIKVEKTSEPVIETKQRKPNAWSSFLSD
jgi:hypothetical protein